MLAVSTEEQVQEGFSIRAQEQKLKDFTRIKDWSIYSIYIDEGISGKNITERPAINRMIEDIKAGHVKNVLVFKIDRLTRSTADLIFLVDLFNQHDCAFNSLMESIDTQTASGRMFLKIIGIFAEFERENIAERIKLACERKVKEGYSLCTHCVSFGYDRPKGQKVQTINENEAKIVREMFDMYVNQGFTLLGMAKSLNVRKICTKKNAVWTVSMVNNVLRNCNYIGKVRYKINDKEKNFEIDGLHESIISNELFQETQILLERNSKTCPTKKPREWNYYAGFLYCKKCGKKLDTHAKYNKKKDGDTTLIGSYRCPQKMIHACDASNMSHLKVEKAFREYIDSLKDLDAIDEIQLEEHTKAKQDYSAVVQGYNERYSQLESKEREVLDLFVKDNITFENYRHMKELIDKDKESINAELEKLAEQDDEEQIINKEDIVNNIKENWEFLTNVQKRQFLLRFIKKIVIVNNKPANERYGIVKIESVEFNNYFEHSFQDMPVA